jgi:hypothetical protein
MKLKTIEKHHYVIHLIIRSNLKRNSFESYINIPSKQLKVVLGRDYISIIKNLEGLNIIDELLNKTKLTPFNPSSH